jgi:hypothetical protein
MPYVLFDTSPNPDNVEVAVVAGDVKFSVYTATLLTLMSAIYPVNVDSSPALSTPTVTL